ncbi:MULTISPECIES: hypothetical protein [Leptospira]|uniref:DUF4935 domain-containing protein n=2 Tax=Leptospira santarosai TaxID=28183 RepID=A0AB73MWQ0_9LEPT|nr:MULTISPECIES: hypothetical protein [Leptospira]AVV78739.1 Uncharacterized protein XB15_00950 [Leptospira santarosai]EKO77162.1 hypothetical protein LEP1GSC068_2208 [Leptospira sp. Fiocruz LV3954]EMI66080.1 hypothetical protein LEP1GSC076_0042 [Leptospira sp. Fiocruz LV4135]EMO20696.1 hypothetical protein LEP1GSC168_3572 [Leptospira santarosai str. HAI134]MDI7217424.1 hypothetical protein [Leptospira santarosai]
MTNEDNFPILIYLDWNVITYLNDFSHLRAEDQTSCESMKLIIEKYLNNENFIFPFSHAHYLDINQGGREYVDSKLENLSKTSNSWRIYEDIPSDYQLKIQILHDVKFDYKICIDSFTNSQTFTSAINLITQPINFAIGGFFKLFSHFLLNSNQKDLILRLGNVIQSQEYGTEILKINKAMRNAFNTEDSLVKVFYPDINKSGQSNQKLNLKELVTESFTNANHFLFPSYEKFFEWLPYEKITIISGFQKEIMKLSDLADLVALVSEDLGKKTSFGSITNDKIHLTMGLRCSIFVSNDKNLLKKAKFIREWMKLNVMIFNIDEFNTFMLKIIYKKENPGINSEKEDIRYAVKRDNGDLIKEYTICINQDKI